MHRSLALSTIFLFVTTFAGGVEPDCDLEQENLWWHSMNGSFSDVTQYFGLVAPERSEWELVTDLAQIYGSRGKALRLKTVNADQAGVYQHRNSSRATALPYGRYRISIHAKGRGTLALGWALTSRPELDAKAWPESYTFQAEPATLTDEWQEVAFEFQFRQAAPAMLSVGLRLHGEGAEAYLDDMMVGRVFNPTYRIETSPSHPMVPRGEPTTVEIRLLHNQRPQPGAELWLMPASGEPTDRTDRMVSSLQADAKGVARLRFDGGEEGVHSFHVVHGASGVVTDLHVDSVPPQVYAQFRDLADRIEFVRPSHILFLGDSLTDMLRGYNHVDKLRFWLNRVDGARVSIKNAAIGGDTISRIRQRIDGRISSYERQRYPQWESLFEPAPDYVFISVGHNDSKLLGSSDWTATAVPPVQFETDLRKVIERVEHATDAHVVVISATSSVFEKTRDKVERGREQGQKHNLFGKPESLKRFNGIMKSVAEQRGASYLDLYTPTRDHADKPSLFRYDGIHTSNRGNRLLALELLEFLAAEE